MRQRIQWIDIAKGIAILAVVIGHTLGPYSGKFFGSLIFAFHMPIFFILSGYLFRMHPINQEAKRGAMNLLLPYLATGVLILMINTVALALPHQPVLNKYFPNLWQGVQSIVYGAGSLVFNPWHWQIQPIGAIWFLLSMFIAIQLFNGVMHLTVNLNRWQFTVRLFIVCSLTVLGGELGQLVYLPWAFNAALFSQLFLYAGYIVKQTGLIHKMTLPWYLLLAFMWLVSAFQGYFSLTVPVSPNLLISALGGISGSLCVIRFSSWLSQYQGTMLINLLERYGRLSLVVLCFHLIDLDVIGVEPWVFARVLPLVGPVVATLISIGYRLAFVTFWVFVIPYLPLLRNCFLPRQYPFRLKKTVN